MNLLFIGGGNMASALIGGLAGSEVPVRVIHVIEPNPDARDKLTLSFTERLKKKGVSLSVDANECPAGFDVAANAWAVLAVKPQHLKEACLHAHPSVAVVLKNAHILSIAAGIETSVISQWCENPRVVRSMPNTPALVNRAITGLFATSQVIGPARSQAEQLLAAVGKFVWIHDESLMDAVTALSGSGPAYVFRFIEALCAGGEALGLNASQSRELAIETLAGALALLQSSGESPQSLREKVTSKGGTTAAALASLDEHQFTQIIIQALKAARDRGAQMSKEFK